VYDDERSVCRICPSGRRQIVHVIWLWLCHICVSIKSLSLGINSSNARNFGQLPNIEILPSLPQEDTVWVIFIFLGRLWVNLRFSVEFSVPSRPIHPSCSGQIVVLYISRKHRPSSDILASADIIHPDSANNPTNGDSVTKSGKSLRERRQVGSIKPQQIQ